MVRRILLPGAILLPLLFLVPACSSDSKTDSKPTTSMPKDVAPPSPKPAGKSG
jgi:hypothetical protein